VSILFRMLIDACVWLDLAKDPRQVPVIGVIEEMVQQKLIELIVPSIVVDELPSARSQAARTECKPCRTEVLRSPLPL
jgi:hypothetical protein